MGYLDGVTKQSIRETVKTTSSFRWLLLKVGALLAAVILLLASLFSSKLRNEGPAGPRLTALKDEIGAFDKQQFSWSDIAPGRDIIWRKCFDDFDCARLDVPLDWLNPSDDARVIIAIIRLQATELNDYKGSVFFNPGGPGGSGVYAMRNRGKSIQKIVGLNHDLISFDPRGIGASTPEIKCWPSEQSAKIWSLLDFGVVDAHPGVIYDAYARNLAFSDACARGMGSTLNPEGSEHGLLSYISTTSVARDMLEILTKVGETKLKYWGFSYGTVIGGVFAALWPDKVERMVNDGNVNYQEWSTNTHSTFSTDSDKVMEAFYKYCHIAGPEYCAFYHSTPEAIETRLDKLLERLKRQPIVVPMSLRVVDLPEIIYYSSVKRLIATSLYQPVFMFPTLARILASLEAGDGTTFVAFYSASQEPLSWDCPSQGDPSPEVKSKEVTMAAFPAVLCSDGGEMDDSIEAIESYTKDLLDASKAAGAVHAMSRMSCVGWRIRAKWRFAGPFTGETSHPILFIGNQADNITPLQSTLMNAGGFTNASVLISDSFGHTSLSTPSSCVAKYIQDYFQVGTLPEHKTVCEPDVTPFQSLSNMSIIHGHSRSELTSAVWELAAKTSDSLGFSMLDKSS